MNPPPAGLNVSLIHRLSELYKTIYLLGRKIPKRDRFGVHARIELLCLRSCELIIAAAFEIKSNKLPLLASARINIEILKRLVRTEMIFILFIIRRTSI